MIAGLVEDGDRLGYQMVARISQHPLGSEKYRKGRRGLPSEH
jgi:hypothetical protein